MKATARHRAAHLPPHRLNSIKTAMHVAFARPYAAEPFATNPTEAPAAPGAHFAGLLPVPKGTDLPGVALDPDEDHDDETNIAEDTHARWGKARAKSIVAERLLQARAMNGYSQGEAAELLGQVGSAQLSQWEQCRRTIPMYMLARASEVYQVSTDWLLGLSEDPLRDPRAARRNACVRATRSILVAAVERVVAAFDADEAIAGLNVASVREVVTAAEEVIAHYGDHAAAITSSRAVVAARLSSAVDRLEGAALKVGIALRRHDDETALMRERLAEIAANDAC